MTTFVFAGAAPRFCIHYRVSERKEPDTDPSIRWIAATVDGSFAASGATAEEAETMLRRTVVCQIRYGLEKDSLAVTMLPC